MAQDEAKFSHITVTSDDEDDVVIQAGIRQPAQPAPAPAEEPEAFEPAPEAAPATEPEPAPAPKAAREDGYRATTAEDLESAPMPIMQKALVVIAVVLVVVMVAYIVTH
ncbi:hypothetical protein [Arabiibacter massiliensis]|uniref:hypothetical protein n=1 Tax=Arabiibacter massiliensis TaxID=1870985 RepID=UPI0009B93718|nr:hypothetical protein [Arabiibacter massiliensis]